MKLSFPKRRNITLDFGKKRARAYLFIGSLAIIALICIIIALPPTFTVSLWGITFSVIPLTFILLGLGVFALITFAFGSTKHGILASLFVLIYFWLRFNKLFHPMFTLLLVALLLTLELLFSAKKEE